MRKQRNFFSLVMVLSVSFTLSGCGLFVAYALSAGISSGKIGTGGTTLGFPESPMWHGSAPQEVKSAHYDKKSTIRLCNDWAASYPGQKSWRRSREQIGMALERRNLPAMYCANPTQDQVSIANREAREARAEAERARREAERQRQQACNSARQAYNQCLQNTGNRVGNCYMAASC